MVTECIAAWVAVPVATGLAGAVLVLYRSLQEIQNERAAAYSEAIDLERQARNREHMRADRLQRLLDAAYRTSATDIESEDT